MEGITTDRGRSHLFDKTQEHYPLERQEFHQYLVVSELLPHEAISLKYRRDSEGD